MRREVYPGIYEGDELESEIYAWVGNSVAFYSDRHTPGNMRSGRISFRIPGYEYYEGDIHSLPASKIRLREQPYDPTQVGDTDEDI
jgi:hypothetical protein